MAINVPLLETEGPLAPLPDGYFAGPASQGKITIYSGKPDDAGAVELATLTLEGFAPTAEDPPDSFLTKPVPPGLYYKLVGREVVECATMQEWLDGTEGGGSKKLWRTAFSKNLCVSTVFLGFNHSLSDGDPEVFETMIFGGKYDQWQGRGTTYDQARWLHAYAVGMLLGVHWSKLMLKVPDNTMLPNHPPSYPALPAP